MGSLGKGVRQLRELLRTPLLAAWALYLFLLPFRVGPSGYPEPDDVYALFLFFATVVGARGLSPRLRSVFVALTWFTIWVFVVDIAWCAYEREWGVNVLNPLYYIFNALLFLTVLMLYQRFGERFIRVTVQTLFVVTLLQVVASFALHFTKVRTSLFFNNSNQLGYYALLTACVIAFTQRRVRFGPARTGVALIACAYLALLSASRAALIGIGVLGLVLLITNPRILVIGVMVAFGLTIWGGGTVSRAISNSERRLTEDRDPNLNFFEDRGYDRIWKNKEYLVTGAGEGHMHRFVDDFAKNPNLEIHSSVGTILFCYGIIGVLLMLGFVLRVVRGANRQVALMLVPMLLHSLAHQGLRFSLMWVVLGLFVVTKEAVRARPKPGPSPQASTALITSPSRI